MATNVQQPQAQAQAPSSLEEVKSSIPTEEYQVVKKNVTTWGQAMLGLTATILVGVIVIVVLVGLIASYTTPIPSAQETRFRFSVNQGGEQNKMQSGAWRFALDADGVARVVNTTTGQESADTPNTSDFTQGLGHSMTLKQDNGVQLTVNSSDGTALAFSVPPISTGGSSLNLLPTGILGWQNSDGTFAPLVWRKSGPPPTT